MALVHGSSEILTARDFPQKLTLVPCESGLDGVSQELASDFEGTLYLRGGKNE
jgi:hypothetical protein